MDRHFWWVLKTIILTKHREIYGFFLVIHETNTIPHSKMQKLFIITQRITYQARLQKYVDKPEKMVTTKHFLQVKIAAMVS